MSPTRFDPYAILRELQEGRVYFVVIGALARVIQGSDELTRGLDLTPSLRPQNLEKLQQALENLNARRTDGKRARRERARPGAGAGDRARERRRRDQDRSSAHRHPRPGRSPPPSPQGIARRGPAREVASAGDLVRMLEAHGATDPITMETMRRVVELDRGLEIER